MVTPRRRTMWITWSIGEGATSATAWVAWANATASMEFLLGTKGGCGRIPAPLTVALREGTRIRDEVAALDRAASGCHQCLIEGHVVQGQHSVREDLPREVEMPEIGAREARARLATTFGIEGALRARVLRVPDVHGPFARERHPVPRVPGGQDAVEEIDAAGDAVQEIAWGAHAHEIPRPLRGQRFHHRT